MPLTDQIKNYARKLTEDRPKRLTLSGMIRKRMPIAKVFADDGIVPNNPRLPMLLYRNAVRFDKEYDPATVVDAIIRRKRLGPLLAR